MHRQISQDPEFLIREFVDDDALIDKTRNLHAGYFAEPRGYGHPPPGAKGLISGFRDAGHDVWFSTSARDEGLGTT